MDCDEDQEAGNAEGEMAPVDETERQYLLMDARAAASLLGNAPILNNVGTLGQAVIGNDQFFASRDVLVAPQKSNAKPVEWLDMEGNVLGVFKSGLETQKALCITQGDISQCCRGIRDSVGGYRFRFFNEDIRPENTMKRGGLDATSIMEERTLRTTRATFRTADSVPGSINVKGGPPSMSLIPAEFQSRKWRKVIVRQGNLIIPKWVSDQDVSPELQALHPKNTETVPKSRKRKSRADDRGSTAHEILGNL